MTNTKRYIFIGLSVVLVLVIGFGIGIYNHQSQNVAEEPAPVDTPAKPSMTNEEISAAAAEIAKQMVKEHYAQARLVDNIRVELVNEPAPEPAVEYAPRYESKEEAAKNPPPKPTKEELAGNSGSSNNGSNSNGNNGNSETGGNNGGSNLVPPGQNPFLQPGAAATNVKEEDASKYYQNGVKPGEGDKF